MDKRLKLVKKVIEKAKKLGLNMDKITEGKTIETLAKSKKTIENLQKRFARQKERPQIQKEVRQYEEKVLKNKRRNLKTDESVATVMWGGPQKIDEEKITKALLKKETDKVASEFMDRFFKQIKFEHEAQKKINKLKKRFGIRLDLVYDLMDYIADYSFKYEMDRDMMREEMPEDFASLLYQRLDEFDRILNREFKI